MYSSPRFFLIFSSMIMKQLEFLYRLASCIVIVPCSDLNFNYFLETLATYFSIALHYIFFDIVRVFEAKYSIL